MEAVGIAGTCELVAKYAFAEHLSELRHECAERETKSPDPAVGDRDALPKTRRAEFLARKQAVEYDRTGNLCLVLKQLTDLFEETFFARRLEVEQNVCFGKQLRDLVQVGSWPEKQSGGRSASDAARRQDGAGLYATSQASSGLRRVWPPA